MEIIESLSYDDVLLQPNYADFMAGDTDISTTLVGDVKLNVPILSAAMDTVTEEKMAIALALNGGAGVIHRNLSPEEQARQVKNVKRYLNWIIDNPITVKSGMSIGDVKRITDDFGVSGLPVLDDNDKLIGIITHRDIMFSTDDSKLVDDLMTTNVVYEKGSPSPESAQAKFHKYKIEKLPVLDDDDKLIGLITVKDMEKHQNYPNAATDKKGRLVVGAAISPHDWKKRIPLLEEVDVDFVSIDVAHGDSENVFKAIRDMKKVTNIPIIGGNSATADGTQRLCEAGCDAVKVGVGPGSICTTRIVAGIGMPQFTAVLEAAKVAKKYGVPVVEDLGSGSFVDTSQFGLEKEPTVQEVLASGVDVVTFSGDKLLGGPQAGLIVGKKEYIDRLTRHPLYRAMRLDKATIYTLTRTISAFLMGEKPLLLHLIAMDADEVKERAERFLKRLKESAFQGLEYQLTERTSSIGGGTFAHSAIPSYGVLMKCDKWTTDAFARKLRLSIYPVVTMVGEEWLALDFRTILEGDEDLIIESLSHILLKI